MSTAKQSILHRELDFFESQRMELLARAPGKYALVKDTTLVGIYDTEIEAVGAGYRQIGNLPFLVKQIVEEDIPLYFGIMNSALLLFPRPA